jgi:hypothetical protein
MNQVIGPIPTDDTIWGKAVDLPNGLPQGAVTAAGINLKV